MKILFVSNYRDCSGYSSVARDMILSMDAAGLNVVPRSIDLLKNKVELPTRIKELEQQSVANCNINIQYTLPHKMDYDGRFEKNIAAFSYETTNFKTTSWKKYLNCMDEVWVHCRQQKAATEDSGVTKLVRQFPHSTDVTKFDKQYPILDELKRDDEFLFYTIGEFSERKDFTSLLRAFHTEFAPSEKVRLVIKTSNQERILRLCSEVKTKLKLYGNNTIPYKDEIVITNFFTDEQINSLHQSCDCFVSTSHAEGWNVPAFDAMGFGNIVLASAFGGHLEYIIDEKTGFLIDGRTEPCFGAIDCLSDIYTAREHWFSCDISNLMLKMRMIFELSKQNDKRLRDMTEAAKEEAYKYSYSNAGEIIKSYVTTQTSNPTRLTTTNKRE